MSADPFARRGQIDVGDTVRHRIIGQLWEVAAIEDDRFYPSGCPPCSLRLANVTLETPATDSKRQKDLMDWCIPVEFGDVRRNLTIARVLPNTYRLMCAVGDRAILEPFLRWFEETIYDCCCDHGEVLDRYFLIDREALDRERALVEEWERERRRTHDAATARQEEGKAAS